MSLKGFHILLISLSSLLALIFGGWSVSGYVETDGLWYLGGAIFSFAAAVGLVLYVVWFARTVRTPEEQERLRRNTIRTMVLAAGTWLCGTDPVSACAVCYGEAEGPMIDAARLGVYLLFGLVLMLQICFVVFFFHLRKRAREFSRNQSGAGLAGS